MPLKILVLSDLWLPFPGGAERLIFNLSRALYRAGHDVSVLTGHPTAQQFDGPPITIHEIGYTMEEREAGASYISSFIATSNPDIILCHHFYASQFMPEIVASGIPIVHVVLNGKTIPEAALGIYITEWAKALHPRPNNSLTVLPMAQNDVVAENHAYGIGFIKPIEHKGIELLYKIAERLPMRQFVVLRGEWQDIEIIKPAHNIHFLEPVVDIRDFYEMVRVVLVPSRSEDAGTVAQEATLNGLPCISSNVEGLLETNAGGILLDRDDVDSWVEWIENLDSEEIYDATVTSQLAALPNAQKVLIEFVSRVEAIIK